MDKKEEKQDVQVLRVKRRRVDRPVADIMVSRHKRPTLHDIREGLSATNISSSNAAPNSGNSNNSQTRTVNPADNASSSGGKPIRRRAKRRFHLICSSQSDKYNAREVLEALNNNKKAKTVATADTTRVQAPVRLLKRRPARKTAKINVMGMIRPRVAASPMTSERAQKISKEQSARMKRQQTIRDEAKNLAAQEMLQELEGGEYCWDVYLAEDVKEAPPEMLDTLSVPTFDYRQLQDGALHIYLTSDDESDSDDGDDEDLDAREYDYGDEEDDFGAQPSKFMVGDWRGENDRNGSYSAPKSTDIYGFSDSEDEEAMRMSYALRHGNTLSDDELDQDYRMK